MLPDGIQKENVVTLRKYKKDPCLSFTATVCIVVKYETRNSMKELLVLLRNADSFIHNRRDEQKHTSFQLHQTSPRIVGAARLYSWQNPKLETTKSQLTVC